MADQGLTWSEMPGILAVAVFGGAGGQRCLCLSRPPPAALPGMRHSLTGDPGGGGADNIPRSFLRGPPFSPQLQTKRQLLIFHSGNSRWLVCASA